MLASCAEKPAADDPVIVTAVFPLRDPQVARVALFIHLVSMAAGFGAVVLLDVYGLLWLRGHRALSDVMALAAAAHGVIAIAIGFLTNANRHSG